MFSAGAFFSEENLAACGGAFFDRINRIYMILIYPDYPVKKWDFLYYELRLLRYRSQ